MLEASPLGLAYSRPRAAPDTCGSGAVRQFATSTAILVSCLGTHLLFGAQLSPQFSLGLALVLIATTAYSSAPGGETRGVTRAHQAAERLALLPSTGSESDCDSTEVSPR